MLVDIGTAAEYRTEIETFQRITAHGAAGNGPGYFVVEDKAGLIRQYGNSPDSRIHPRSTSESSHALIYAVNQVQDRYGNTIEYFYDQESHSLAYRPVAITYANADGATVGKVVLSYELRADIAGGWLKGFRREQP